MRAILASLTVALLAGAAAAGGEPPVAKEEKDKVVLANDEITVWFQGKKPLLKIFPTGDEDRAYGFKFDRVVEFDDANGDGLATPDEVKAFLNLAAANAWHVEQDTAEDSATIRLTLEAPLKLRGPADLDVEVPTERLTANVTLVFAVHADAADVESLNGTMTVEAAEVKYDFVVNRWSWVDPGHKLALLGEVPADLATTGEATAAIESNGTRLGAVAWLPTAVATTGGEDATVDVLTGIESTNGTARIQHAFDASGFDALVYDPVFAVASTGGVEEAAGGLKDRVREAPGLGAIAAVAVAAGVVALRRR